MKRDVYQSVTDSIIALLERELPPWRKPWTDSKSIDSALPFNASTGRHYNGINVPLLWGQAQGMGYATNGWLTYKQAQACGGHVRKGEKGTLVVFWKFLEREDENGNQKTIPMARGYTVFNVEQCADVDTKAGTVPEPVEPDNVISWAQSVGATVRHGGNRACYVPSQDFIQLPRPEQFASRELYHATALHELTHWTGHKSRLDRAFGSRFGTEAYAFEELIAEMGAAFLCASIGVQNVPLEDHASYLRSWLKILKQDKRAIFTAARHAQKASDFCLENSRQLEAA